MLEAIIGIFLVAALFFLVLALASNVKGREQPEVKEVPYVPEVSEEQLKKWLGG